MFEFQRKIEKYSENKIKQEASIILRMYGKLRDKKTQLEDLLESPMTLLKLVTQSVDSKPYFRT